MSTTTTTTTSKPGIFTRALAKIKLWACEAVAHEPTVAKAALATLDVIGPEVPLVLTLCGEGAVAPEATAIIAKVEAGLASLTVMVEDGKAATTVAGQIQAVQADCSAFLEAIGVGGTKAAAEVEAWVAELGSILVAILPSPTPASATAPQPTPAA